MHYGTIKPCDIADGPGVRVSLFVSGCRNHCKGCFQPETWDFEYGEEYTDETEERILALIGLEYIQGLSILGGEPMEPENQGTLTALIAKTRELYPMKDIWCYTGYTIESLTGREDGGLTLRMLSMIDILVDGQYRESEKDLRIAFRGSRNQRIIDVRKYMAGEDYEISHRCDK